MTTISSGENGGLILPHAYLPNPLFHIELSSAALRGRTSSSPAMHSRVANQIRPDVDAPASALAVRSSGRSQPNMLAKARSQGLILMENLDNIGALDQLPPTFGAMIAQELAQTRQGTAGALLLHSCVPVSEFSESWPTGIQVQIHGMDRDDFFLEDLPAAKELSQRDEAELFLYPGDQHLFHRFIAWRIRPRSIRASHIASQRVTRPHPHQLGLSRPRDHAEPHADSTPSGPALNSPTDPMHEHVVRTNGHHRPPALSAPPCQPAGTGMHIRAFLNRPVEVSLVP